MTTDRLNDDSLLKLTPAQARKIAGDPAQAEWAILRLLALARERADAADAASHHAAPRPDLSAPSAMVAPHLKRKSRKKPKKRGRAVGHAGARRAAPPRIDHRVEHQLKCCPDCGKKVSKSGKPRARVVEDLAPTGAEATEHAIHQYYCQHCKKRVEPKVTHALAKSTIGNRALALTAWLHYGLGNTVSQIEQVLARVFQLPISGGGLAQQWQRLGEILAPWHGEILESARRAAVLNADETGWRVNGKTHWLWCFASSDATAYVIDRSRGSGVLLEFLGESFAGTLVSDFFGAYNKIAADRRQVCLVHLLREIKRVGERNASKDWTDFAKPLKRLLRDAIKLAARADRDAPDWLSKRARIKRRFDDLCFGDVRGDDAHRILKRLLRHEAFMFTFLDDLAVPPDNNRAEREIRPAVIARKNSFHNTSDRGARTQAAMMSVYRTLRLRGRDPLAEIVKALERFILDGKLPPLPGAATENSVPIPPPPNPAPPDG
jgi:transposase